MLTYYVRGCGSHGPASPYYNPQATATLFRNGEQVHCERFASGAAAHEFALRQGAKLAPGESESGGYKKAALALGLITL